ncbi:signal peptidase I [Kitasatospora viridis]|uniref:Signal peptidase I n=1 Tax=Kitasatospora viridis TaxID=281105 RepID=A0A561UBK0_9ACTN|nr:signal peptidase I [Kitasatospora viridis]TWF96726.1 signal peptidase I [Kitasatospora viridis]
MDGERAERRRGLRWRGRTRKQRPFWQELPILVVLALLLALVIKSFFVQAFSIPSGSMENTLQPGDRVLVDKLTPWFGAKPERGDVVVFKDPDGWLDDEPVAKANVVQEALSYVGLMPAAGDRDLIKRVIAVGGDTVDCEAGKPVTVNGVALNEPYIFPGSTPCDDYPVGKITVPKDHLWVMGDHRNNSADSRYHQVRGPGDGFVPESDVVGRAFAVAWPLTHWATLPVPSTFQQHGLAQGGGAVGMAAAVPVLYWYRRRQGS